ncbi:MAG: haloacid dehalogenase [Planctomycetaceae bacterium]|nr:haloacid dehalogenase [Planctomycetaceae bacterium]
MRVLLFDIDGTLISTGGAGGAALREAFRNAFNVVEAADVPFAGRTDRGIGSNLFREHQIEDSETNWTKLRNGYLERLPFHLADRDGRVLDGVATLLEELSKLSQVAVGLLTGNTDRGARIKLSHYELNEHFAFGGFGDEHRHRNDVAKAALQEAEQYLNGNGKLEHVWVIGDTPLDVACARAIDAKVIAVSTGGHTAEELSDAKPDVLLQSLADTERVLELLS